MLVNSFDTKYASTALKFESLDNIFTSLLSRNNKFKRIFTSVLENKSLSKEEKVKLRSDITGQVLNTVITHDPKSRHCLYYMGDIFREDLINNEIKQYRQHGLEIINYPKNESFEQVIKILDNLLKKILKNNYIFIFTDPKLKNKSKFIIDTKAKKNQINSFIHTFKAISKSPYEINLESNFFSQDYHQDIFFYVYSVKSKKILAQGGGYHYSKNKSKIDGFGFSCNVDNLSELI